jgi:hypothetical protein
MIDFLIYCVGHEVFIYLAVDLPQASTLTGCCAGEGAVGEVCCNDRCG